MQILFLLFSAFFLVFSNTIYAQNERPEVHVITVCDKNCKGLQQLIRSCTYYGIDMKVLGMGQPFWVGGARGKKLTYINEYVQNVPDEDIVLFVDGLDVFFLAPLDKILDHFLSCNIPCVFGTEITLWPHANLKDKFPISRTKFRYLNSGFIMGYAGYLKSMLHEMSPLQENQSDQGQFQLYYIKHQSEIMLDYFCEFVINLKDVNMKELKLHPKRKGVECLITGTFPMIIHGNGQDKSIYQKIFDEFFPNDKK